MIQVATGVIFLMSSVYGAGHANTQSIQTAAAVSATESAITRTLTNQAEMESYLRKEFASTPILVEVARCESTFRQFDQNGIVIRGIVNKADVGVMQINEKYHADTAVRLGHDIYSIEGNVAFAKYLYKKYGTSPWSSSEKCWSTSAIAQK